MLTSSKTYDRIWESDFVYLPSRRTLSYYTNWIKLSPGFNAEVSERNLRWKHYLHGRDVTGVFKITM